MGDVARRAYWLFTYDNYYPAGGYSDYHSRHESLQDAMLAGSAAGLDYADVLTVHEGDLFAIARYSRVDGWKVNSPQE